jgi:hypothetical protein
VTTLLLDYRWELVDALNNPDVSVALRKFVNLLRKTGLTPAPFIEDHQQDELWLKLGQEPPRNGEWQQLMEFLDLCRRPDGSVCRAVPDHEPTGISDNWKRALRDQLIDPLDWRTPHIVVPESRLTEWGANQNEVAIRCEKCNGQPASGPHHRVFAALESYESHPFAISDLDPWDLRRIHPPIPDRPRQHPALLPKPRLPIGFPLQDIHDYINAACAFHWEVEGRYCFIPPKDFDPLNIDKETWRKGRAFRYETSPDSNRSGPVDYNGIVWSWDEHERHWDVQTKPKYMRISHTGERLPDPD